MLCKPGQEYLPVHIYETIKPSHNFQKPLAKHDLSPGGANFVTGNYISHSNLTIKFIDSD